MVRQYRGAQAGPGDKRPGLRGRNDCRARRCPRSWAWHYPVAAACARSDCCGRRKSSPGKYRHRSSVTDRRCRPREATRCQVVQRVPSRAAARPHISAVRSGWRLLELTCWGRAYRAIMHGRSRIASSPGSGPDASPSVTPARTLTRRSPAPRSGPPAPSWPPRPQIPPDGREPRTGLPQPRIGWVASLAMPVAPEIPGGVSAAYTLA
jgi:hypothetical protein